MWELDQKNDLAPKNWYHWITVLEMSLESSLDSKEIKPVSPKGNQPWFIGRTDAEAETAILWTADPKSWLFGKDPITGENWGQEKKWGQRARWLDSFTDSIDMSLSKLSKIMEDREAYCAVSMGLLNNKGIEFSGLGWGAMGNNSHWWSLTLKSII